MWIHLCLSSCAHTEPSRVVIIITTLNSANTNWETLTPKTQRSQQGRQPVKESKNYRMNRKKEKERK